MKIKYTATIAILLLVALYACRKDISGQQDKSVITTFSIQRAKNYLDSALKSNTGIIKLQSLDSGKSNNQGVIYWTKARPLTAQEFGVIEVPLILRKKIIGLYDIPADSVVVKPDKSVLIAAFSRIIVYQNNSSKTIDRRIITYIPDKSYLLAHHNDASNNWLDKFDNDFSGYLEYKTWDGTIQYVIRMVAGKKRARYLVTLGAKQQLPPTKAQVNAIKVNDLSCAMVWVPEYVQGCAGDGEGNPTDDCTEMREDGGHWAQVCHDTGSSGPDPGSGGGTPQPPGGGGSGGGGGGGGGVTNPGNNPPPPGIPNLTSNPCADKVLVGSMEAAFASGNGEIRARTNASGSTRIEYAAEQRVTSSTSTTFKYVGPHTDNLPDQVSMDFTWNYTDGFTIGYSHSHPNGTAPSLDDVFSAIKNLRSSALVNTGNQDVDFYKNHYSVTVLTDAGSYVVTIKDWDALSTLYDNYQAYSYQFEQNYENISIAHGATAYALLYILGDSINVYIAQGTNSTTYTPIHIDSSDALGLLPCNN